MANLLIKLLHRILCLLCDIIVFLKLHPQHGQFTIRMIFRKFADDSYALRR